MDDLHQHIFLLFYSIACAEGTIREEEVNRVNLELLKPWIEIENHHQVLQAWQALQSNGVDSIMAFSKFKDYYNLNPQRFTKELKAHLCEICGNIAVAFAGNNKSELTLLAQLYFLFKE